MEKKTRYTLGKTERLKSRKSIECLFKEGSSFSIFPFRILYQFYKHPPSLPDAQIYPINPSLQAGFTVSSRHFKKAVDRNRIKRLMRESWRLQKNQLHLIHEVNKTVLTVFLIYIGKELPQYELIYEKSTLVLKRLIKLTRETK